MYKNIKKFCTDFHDEFEKTNLTKEEITIIENKIRELNNHKLMDIFNDFCSKKIPLKRYKINDIKKAEKRVKHINQFLEKYDYKIVIKAIDEKKRKKEMKKLEEEKFLSEIYGDKPKKKNRKKMESNNIINEIEYMIFPKVIISLDNEQKKSIIFFEVFGFEKMICYDVMLDIKTFKRINILNKFFKRDNITISQSDYTYIKLAIDDFVEHNEKKIELGSIRDSILINNYDEKPWLLDYPFKELDKATGIVRFNGKNTYRKLIDASSKSKYNELFSMISYLTLSFINGYLVKNKIAPNFVLLIKGEKDANALNVIKYIFGNNFNNASFSFEDNNESNYFTNEYEVEKIIKYVSCNMNNLVIVNLFYEVDKSVAEDFENNLFVKYKKRNDKDNKDVLNSNVILYSSMEYNNDIYFKLKLINEINELPKKEYYITLLYYFSEFLEDEVNSNLIKSYQNICDSFEEIKYVNTVTKNKIYLMSILTLGLEIFLKFGLKLEAITTDQKTKLINGFKNWISQKEDIPQNSFRLAQETERLLEQQILEILRIIQDEYRKTINSAVNYSNELLLLRKGNKPAEGYKYFGWYDVNFKNKKFEENNKNPTSEVVFLEKDFIDKITKYKSIKIECDIEQFKNKLNEKEILLKYLSDPNSHYVSVTLYPKNKQEVLVLSINRINKHLKQKVE